MIAVTVTVPEGDERRLRAYAAKLRKEAREREARRAERLANLGITEEQHKASVERMRAERDRRREEARQSRRAMAAGTYFTAVYMEGSYKVEEVQVQQGPRGGLYYEVSGQRIYLKRRGGEWYASGGRLHRTREAAAKQAEEDEDFLRAFLGEAPRADARATLGVPAGASKEELKIAFRKLAMEHHPDRGGDPARFNTIRKAYEALTCH